MARMIPSTVSSDTISKAEKKIFKKLRALDDSYTVFHSLDMLARNREDKLIDAEIDFLILSEKYGLLILEVKGGIIKYDGIKGEWMQNGYTLKKSPYKQAKNNKYTLKDYLEKKTGRKLQIPIGHAVCFPDVLVDEMVLPPEAGNEITITGRQEKYIDMALPEIMKNFSNNGKFYPIKGIEFSDVRKTLMPVFEYGRSLSDIIEKGEERIFTLTGEQCNLLDFIEEKKRVLIKGYAGTGKTVLALKKACELAQNGKSVLLLCFNIPLSEYLRESVKKIKGNITTSNYHSFCQDKLREAGIEPDVKNDSEFWQKTLPSLFYNHLKKNPIKYDAIIIDEGQDFFEDYWITIEEMLNPDSIFYIFYDPDQNLYGTKLSFPIDDEPFVLKTNCRNTKEIFNSLSKHSDRSLKINEGAPEGKPVEEIKYRKDTEGRKALQKLLHQLINEEGINRNSIVILGGHSIEKTYLKDKRKLGNFTIADEREATGDGVIRYYTYLRFKGCESPVVILLDVDSTDERWSDNALYTAMSRARMVLNVLRRES